MEAGASSFMNAHKLKIRLRRWWLWCSGSTGACEALSMGSTPISHPIKKSLTNRLVVFCFGKSSKAEYT